MVRGAGMPGSIMRWRPLSRQAVALQFARAYSWQQPAVKPAAKRRPLHHRQPAPAPASAHRRRPSGRGG